MSNRRTEPGDGPSVEALAEVVGLRPLARRRIRALWFGPHPGAGGQMFFTSSASRADGLGAKRQISDLMQGNDVVLAVSGRWAAGLFGTVLGFGLAVRKRRGWRQPQNNGTVSDWGESLGLVYGLRLEISRLRQEIERLQEEQRDLLRILTRVGELLERETRRIR
jgi:hypothetical protein